MKKVIVLGLMVLMMSSITQAQYKGKYEGWATGYRFTGSLTAACYKAFTHIVDFGTMVSGSGTASGGSASFVSGCHTNNCKALLCIGGAGNSSAFSSACSTPAGITKLVKSIMASVRSGGYDGADMDWEEGEESGGFDGNATKVAMFGAFHKEMADSLHAAGKMATAALVFDWYPNGSRAAGQWEDQANSMTYYDPVTSMPNFVGPNQIGSVPKTKVGVGFGWDTDNEITDPNDILAKCRWAIDNGYGGIMAWHITRATTITSWILDSIAHYVTHSPVTDELVPAPIRFIGKTTLSVRNSGVNGISQIFYSVPSNGNGSIVDLGIYDVKGTLVKNLVHGTLGSGAFSIPMETKCPGTYVVKLSTDSRVQTTKALVVK